MAEKTSDNSKVGLPKNTAAALSVVLSPTIVGTLVFVLFYKEKYVRFYGMQSLTTFLLLIVLTSVLSEILRLGSIAGLISILWFILWLAMVYKAWLGDEWEIPVIGQISRQVMAKLKL